MQNIKSFLKKLIRKWYFWVIAFFIFIIVLASSDSPEKTEPISITPETVQTEQAVVSEPITETPVTPTASAPIAQPAPSPAPQSSGYTVISVVDGDTIKVDINGTTETLRIIGLNTPETVDPRKPVECFGKEASNKAKELLSGKTVMLEADPSQGERDKYGRLLRYVFLADSTDYGKFMISSGYAHEYTYNTPYKYQTAYKAAQANAQANQLGLWSPSACNSAPTTNPSPAPVSAASGAYYTSSYSTSKYYYPASCDGWKALKPKYLQSFDTLGALLARYPSRTKSPSCQ